MRGAITIRTSFRAASSSASRWRARSCTGPSFCLPTSPTGNLDQRTGAAVADLLFALNREHGTTLVLVTHDIAALAGHAAKRSLRLADGRIATNAWRRPRPKFPRPHRERNTRGAGEGKQVVKPLTFAARSLRREFLHGELATLFWRHSCSRVAALAAVATLANRVERAIVASAAELIGGDLGISHRAGRCRTSFATEARQARTCDDRHRGFSERRVRRRQEPPLRRACRRCRISVARRSFPCAVRHGWRRSVHVHTPVEGSVYVDHEVLVALDVAVGAKVQVGGRDFSIAGDIVRSPDSGNVFRLAPRLVMNLADAQAIGLTGAGSRVRHRLARRGRDQRVVDVYAAWAKARLPDGRRDHDRRGRAAESSHRVRARRKFPAARGAARGASVGHRSRACRSTFRAAQDRGGCIAALPRREPRRNFSAR